jgi:hypothetical protein
MAPMSEKQTHRKLSGSVELGQFSTQSGLKSTLTSDTFHSFYVPINQATVKQINTSEAHNAWL